MNINKLITFLVITLFLYAGCNVNEEISLPLKDSISVFTLDNFYEENTLLNSTIDSIYLLMSPHDRISQMIISSTGAGTNNYDQLSSEAQNGSIGGAVFLGKNSNLGKRIALLQQESRWPLLLSMDAEPSLINSRLTDLDQVFEKTSKAKNMTDVKNISMEIAEILLSIGIHQNYAPVSDLSANRSVINHRSFGNDVLDVKSKTNAFIQEHQLSGVVATVKHFPGHGNAKGDSHEILVSINDLNEELDIFKSNIESNVISVMVGHISVKTGEFATSGHPSSISREITTNLLKNKLGFKGIVITDAMNMKGVTSFENADLKAIEAGNDLVLMPKDPHMLISQIKQKATASKEFRKQIKTSIKKIIRLKLCLGLFKESHLYYRINKN